MARQSSKVLTKPEAAARSEKAESAVDAKAAEKAAKAAEKAAAVENKAALKQRKNELKEAKTSLVEFGKISKAAVKERAAAMGALLTDINESMLAASQKAGNVHRELLEAVAAGEVTSTIKELRAQFKENVKAIQTEGEAVLDGVKTLAKEHATAEAAEEKEGAVLVKAVAELEKQIDDLS